MSLSLGGASASMAGSATSIVSGGGSMADMGSKGGGDNTSITSDMVDVDNKVRSFYNETEVSLSRCLMLKGLFLYTSGSCFMWSGTLEC